MKEDFIEKDKDRSKYGWLPKMATCSKDPLVFVFWYQISAGALILIKYLPGETPSSVMVGWKNY